jgi:hypothetical protein
MRRSIEIIRREHQIQRESIVFIVNQVEIDESSSFQVEINKNISKTYPIFKGKSKETEGFTPTSEKYTQRTIVLHTHPLKICHPQGSAY